MRCPARNAVAAVAWAILAARAVGQITVDDVRFGWDKFSVPQRWSPVSLSVTGGPAGFSGIVSIEYPQDSTQRAVITAPIAATPGASTRVDVPVCLSGAQVPITVRIIGPGGVVYRERFATGEGGTKVLDLSQSTEQWLILIAGDASAADLARAAVPESPPTPPGQFNPDGGEGNPDTPERRERRWSGTRIIQRELSDLPGDPVLYDSFECIVLGAGDDPARGSLGTREEAALRAWVESGGWLVVTASAGDAWRRWAFDAAAGEAVVADPLASVALPEVVATEVRDRLRPDERAAFAPAAKVSARLLGLTPVGERLGWSLRWRVGEARGLIAEGPLGLGMVTVVGCDPRAMSATLSSAATRAAWKGVLESALQPMFTRSETSSWWGMSSMAATEEQTRAIGAAMDRVAAAPRVGVWMFAGIAAGMGLLTLLVGPVDAVVLRRLGLRHRSWLTALVWIGVGSAGAYMVPLLFRSGPSEVKQFSVIDAVAREDGSVGASHRSTVIGLYAQRSGAFTAGDQAPAPGSWLRGVGSLRYGQERPVFSPLELRSVPAAGSRAVIAGEVPVPQWTFRTLLESAPGPGVLGVKIERELGEHRRVVVSGLVGTERITGAWIEEKGRRRSLEIAGEPGAWTLTTGDADGWVATGAGAEIAGAEPEAWLPGADRRREALLRLQAGSHAVVVLRIEGLPMSWPVGVGAGPLTTGHAALVRVAAPLSADGGQR